MRKRALVVATKLLNFSLNIPNKYPRIPRNLVVFPFLYLPALFLFYFLYFQTSASSSFLCLCLDSLFFNHFLLLCIQIQLSWNHKVIVDERKPTTKLFAISKLHICYIYDFLFSISGKIIAHFYKISSYSPNSDNKSSHCCRLFIMR